MYAAQNAVIVNNTLIDVAQIGHAAILIDTSETYIGDNPELNVASRDITLANNIVTMSSTSTRPAFEIREGGLTGTLQTAANRYFDAGGSAEFRDPLASWTKPIPKNRNRTVNGLLPSAGLAMWASLERYTTFLRVPIPTSQPCRCWGESSRRHRRGGCIGPW